MEMEGEYVETFVNIKIKIWTDYLLFTFHMTRKNQ